jgi:uncharacterized membrane protein
VNPNPPVSPLDPEALPRPAPRTWRQRFQRVLVAGLVVLVPVALTAFVLYQLFQLLDDLFEPLILRWIGVDIPGIGVALTLVVILLLGWLSTNVLGRRLIHIGERLVARVPIGRSVYSASKSVLEILSERQADAFKRVVLIEYPRKGLFSIAFVTGKLSWTRLHPDLDDALTVFLPTTPNPTSGYLLIVPPSEVIDLPITVEDGVRLVISGGMLLPKSTDLRASTPADHP